MALVVRSNNNINKSECEISEGWRRGFSQWLGGGESNVKYIVEKNESELI